MRDKGRREWSKERLGAWAALVFGAAWLGGCNDQGLTVAEADVVLTIEDEGRDYSAYKSFYLPDLVADLCPSEDDGSNSLGGQGMTVESENCDQADHRLDDELLDALRAEMLAIGYDEVTDPEHADLAFFVGILARDNWVSVSYPGYCYPYGYYYWGCWYPSYAYTYNLETNAYLIDLADASETDRGRVSTVWTAILQGLAQPSSEKTGADRVREAVQQAFDQSPYLEDGGAR